MANNITLTKTLNRDYSGYTAGDEVSVTIISTAGEVEENVQKKLDKVIPKPVPPSSHDSKSPTTLVIDLLRINHTMTINGVAESLTDKNLLIQFIKDGGPVSLTWDGGDIDSFYIKKIQVTDNGPESGEGRWEIILTGQKGEARS